MFLRRTTFNLKVKKCVAGFTLLELLIVSMLMVSVVTITAGFWRSISLSMNNLAARSKTAEEMRFVVENISRDFGPAIGATAIDGDHLLICRDSIKNPNGLADWTEPDIIIEYFLSDGQLHRFDQSTESETTVADGVSMFSTELTPGSEMYITVELQQNDTVRRVTFIWRQS